MSECNCSMRQQLVGDGCHICNPELAKDLSESDLVEILNIGPVVIDTRGNETQYDINGAAIAMSQAAVRIEELESREVGYIQSLRELEDRVRELEAESAELKEKSVKKDRVTKTTLSPDDYKIIKNDIEFEIRYHIEANNPMNLEFCVENILNRCSIYSGDK